jgi:4-aminobutyrate aminotransferase-like enzyme
VNARAPELHEGLLKLKKQFPDVIRDVRGKGLMIGVEFDASLNYTFAAEVSKLCLHQGFMIFDLFFFCLKTAKKKKECFC